MAFALLAGAGTAISPCVLPVLPAVVSAGATGGRRRPLGVVLGLAISFTVTLVALATVVDGVGLGASPVRNLALAALALVGVVVAVPTRDGRPPPGRAGEPDEQARDLRGGEQAAGQTAPAGARPAGRDADQARARGPRRGARLHRQRPLVQLQAAVAGAAEGPCRARRLLD